MVFAQKNISCAHVQTCNVTIARVLDDPGLPTTIVGVFVAKPTIITNLYTINHSFLLYIYMKPDFSKCERYIFGCMEKVEFSPQCVQLQSYICRISVYMHRSCLFHPFSTWQFSILRQNGYFFTIPKMSRSHFEKSRFIYIFMCGFSVN